MNNIITISGDPVSGKSSIRKALKMYFEEQGKKVILYSTGDIFRSLAREKGMTVTEFNEFLQKNNTDVDASIDNAVKEFGKRVIEKNDENKIYIIDSRLAWFNIPSSFKVRLTTTDRVAGRRVFDDETRGAEDKFPDLETAIRTTKERKESEIKRYIDLYGKEADIQKDENFDLIINNSADFRDPEKAKKFIEAMAKLIAESMELKNSGAKDIPRYWTSPKIFLPTQSIRTTGEGMDNITKSIKKYGFTRSRYIDAVKVDDILFAWDGHHRCYCAILAGIELIPYQVIAKDDDFVYESHNTVKELVLPMVFYEKYNSQLYDYEDVFKFRFTECNPDAYRIAEILKTKEEQLKKVEQTRTEGEER